MSSKPNRKTEKKCFGYLLTSEHEVRKPRKRFLNYHAKRRELEALTTAMLDPTLTVQEATLQSQVTQRKNKALSG